VTLFGVLVGLALLLALFRWTTRLPWLLSLSLGAPASATVVAAGQSVAAFQLILLVAAPIAMLGWIRTRHNPFDWPGFPALVVLVAWTGLVTLAGPVVFDGVDVLSPRGGIDEQIADPSPLAFTVSNLAQVAYLVLGAVLICLLAGYRRLTPHLLAPGLGLAMALSAWRLLHDKAGIPYPLSFFDNSTGGKYIDTTSTGAYRLRGVFPEPAGLALYAIAALVLAVAMIARTRGWARVGYLALAVVAAVNLFYARSGTAVIAGGVIAAMALAVAVERAFRRGAAVMPLAILACAATTAFLVFYQPVVSYLGGLIGDKVASTSYFSRTEADLFALRLAVDTFGLGVGLGSNRPSSLWPMLVSCVGVVGTVAYLVLVLTLLVRAARVPIWRPMFWVLLAVLVTKSVAGSNLSDPLLVFSLGLCAYAAARGSGAEEPEDAPAEVSSDDEAAAPERSLSGLAK